MKRNFAHLVGYAFLTGILMAGAAQSLAGGTNTSSSGLQLRASYPEMMDRKWTATYLSTTNDTDMFFTVYAVCAVVS